MTGKNTIQGAGETDASDGNDVDAITADCIRVRRAVADVNQEAADVVQQTAELPKPYDRSTVYNLAETHDALVDCYAAVVDALEAVERAIETADATSAHRQLPSQTVEERASDLQADYDDPVCSLALMLLNLNKYHWLYGKPKSNGAREVREHGLTGTQRHALARVSDVNADDSTDADTDSESENNEL